MTPEAFLLLAAPQQAQVLHTMDGDETQVFHADIERYIDQLDRTRPKLRRYDGAIGEDMSPHERGENILRRAIVNAREGARALMVAEEADVVARARAAWRQGHMHHKMTSAVRAEHAAHAESARVKRKARAAT